MSDDLARRLREHAAELSEVGRAGTPVHALLSEAAEEIQELQATLDMTWAAQQRAIKIWQEAHGKPETWPDHAKLVGWLLGERGRLQLLPDMLQKWLRISAHYREALDVIAGNRMCLDTLLGNADIAALALKRAKRIERDES